jgi:hypothetical protein
MAPRQLTNLKIREVSGVDSMANKHAHVLLFKRDDACEDGNYPSAVLKREFTADERKARAQSGHALPDGSFPIDNKSDLENAVRAIGRAKNPAKAKAHIKSRARALGATDMLPDTWSKRDSGVAVMKFFATIAAEEIAKAWGDGESIDFDTAQEKSEEIEAVNGLMCEVNEAVCALGTAMWSIQNDDAVADKNAAVQEALNQFGEHVKTIVPEGVENAMVAAALLDAGYHLNAQGGIELSKGADSMTYKAIAKSLGMPETATEAEVLAKLAENDVVAKRNEVIAKMSAKHKAFHEKMTGDAADKFAAKTPAERDAQMADAEPDEDDVGKMIAKGAAFKTSTGLVLKRTDYASQAAFDFAKGQAAESVQLRADIAKRDETIQLADFTKRAEPLIHIGKADEIGGVLQQIAKHDPKLAEKVEAMLKGANKLIGESALMSELGRTVLKAGSAAEAINKSAEEIRKADTTGKMSIEKARVEARKRNPELAKREEDERDTNGNGKKAA